MTSTYTGGLGTRDGGDLVRWTLDIDNGMESIDTFGRRGPAYAQVRPTEAKLTLHAVSKEESLAVIAMLNELRGGGPQQYAKPSPIGNRFSGLEFD